MIFILYLLNIETNTMGDVKMKGCRFILIILSTVLFILFILSLSILIIAFNNEVSNLKIYNPSIFNKITFLFTEYENWENLFSPAAVFFTGLSAISTLFLIYLQITIIRDQDISSKKSIFIKCMEQMFTSRNNIINSLSSIDKSYSGIKIFHRLDEIINNSFLMYGKRTFCQRGRENYEFVFYTSIYNLIKKRNNTIPAIFSNIEKFLDFFSNHTLNPYFHNVYATLKMIDESKVLTKSEKEQYLMMLRSQFTQQEFNVIYAHALIYKDNGSRKFKRVIENTSFFHSFHNVYLKKYIDNNMSKEFSYREKAF